jgi:hypothetical protein
MKHRILALTMGLGLGLGATLGLSTSAFAYPICGTGLPGAPSCSPTTPPEGGPPTTPSSSGPVTSSSSALAFTGADIEGMTAFGAGALVAGGLLLRLRRHRAAKS